MEYNYIIEITTTKETLNEKAVNTIKEADILNKYPFMNYIAEVEEADRKEAIIKRFDESLKFDLTAEDDSFIMTLNHKSCVKRLEKTYETFEKYSKMLGLDKELFPYMRGLMKVLLTNQFGEYVIIDKERIISVDDYMAELIFAGTLDNQNLELYVSNIYEYHY